MRANVLGQVRSYAANALDRRFRPERLVQTNTTPFNIIFQDGLMCVRHYPRSQAEEAQNSPKRLPILFLPPLGVPAWVYDLMHDRSLVRFFSEAGWEVYLVDWGSPGPLDAHYDLTHYVTDWLPKAVSVVSEHAGEHAQPKQISLAGYCMGGLMALMYLGARSSDRFSRPLLAQDKVRNVITIASPIDFHDTSGTIGKIVNFAMAPLKMLEHNMPSVVDRLESALPGRLFHVPGKRVSQAFSLTQPFNKLTSYLNLLWNLADRSYVIQYTALSRWFDDMLDYPGGVVRNMLFDVVPANRLKQGGIRLGDYRVDLRSVYANLLAIIGRTDNIVSAQAAASIMALVGSADKTLVEASGGHAGVFAGHSAPVETWGPMREWLLSRSCIET